jgi:phage terminase large subunit-like protein
MMARTSSRKLSDGSYFDEAAADRACEFFERFLVHTKGKWAGRPFELMEWQKEQIIRPLFGWKRKDGNRKYRTAYIEIPRKNGKSTLSAGIALYLLSADGEYGAEVYSAAGDREQARIVFEDCKQMINMVPALKKRLKSFKNTITFAATNSNYKVLSADAETKHGFNASGIIFDELHTQPNRDLWDVLTTSTGAREQPLVVAITTAGYDRNSICWEQHEYARKVRDGLIEDPSFFSFIAAADETDDWTDPVTWQKANPGLGQTIKMEYLQDACFKAQQTPALQNTFRRLHLNQWTSQATRWMDMSVWDATASMVVPENLKGRECYAGLDLASTTDIAAFVLVFPPQGAETSFQVLPFFWIPGDNVKNRIEKDRVPYDVWIRNGFVTATDGNIIHYAAIRKKIEQLSKTYDIKEIAFDRWGAVQLSQELSDAGMTVIPFGQGFASMSPPTKELLNLVIGKQLAHGGNPVLRWMADNLVVRQDPAGNIKPDKAKSSEKIDGMVALIMGLDRAIRHENQKQKSIYTERGLISL